MGKQDVYLDVADHFLKLIRAGVYRSGDRLPSVRVAASELHVNPNTVAKAYLHLESRGVLTSLPKKGAFVTYGPHETEESPAAPAETLDSQVALLCRNTLSALKDSGISREDILKIIEEVYTDDRD